MKHFLIFISLISIAAADELLIYLRGAWESFFGFVNAYLWIFSILPLVVAIYALSLSKKAIRSRREKNNGVRPARWEEVGIQVGYVISSVFSMFIVYGIFVLAYANGDSIATGWNVLVAEQLRYLFSIPQ